MHISTSHEFTATPTQVAEMMTDLDFLAGVAERSGAREHTAGRDGDVTTLSLTLDAPSAISGLVGESLRLVQSTTWLPASGEERRNRVEVTVAGLPVTMTADGVLTASGTGTVLTYDGDLNVRIPLIGRKIEQEAAPFLLHALDVQAEVGNAWLTERYPA